MADSLSIAVRGRRRYVRVEVRDREVVQEARGSVVEGRGGRSHRGARGRGRRRRRRRAGRARQPGGSERRNVRDRRKSHLAGLTWGRAGGCGGACAEGGKGWMPRRLPPKYLDSRDVGRLVGLRTTQSVRPALARPLPTSPFSPSHQTESPESGDRLIFALPRVLSAA